jgi:hypothetical protein
MSFVPIEDDKLGPEVLSYVCNDHSDWFVVYHHIRDNGSRYATAYSKKNHHTNTTVPTKKMMMDLKKELCMNKYTYDKQLRRVELSFEP